MIDWEMEWDAELFELLNELYPSWQHVSLTKQGYIVERTDNIITLMKKLQEWKKK